MYISLLFSYLTISYPTIMIYYDQIGFKVSSNHKKVCGPCSIVNT